MVEFARFIAYNDEQLSAKSSDSDMSELKHLYDVRDIATKEYINSDGLDENDESAIQTAEMSYKGHLSKVSNKNEVAAWNIINKACDEALSKFPTSLN